MKKTTDNPQKLIKTIRDYSKNRLKTTNLLAVCVLLISYIFSYDAIAQSIVWQHRIAFPAQLLDVYSNNYNGTPLIPTSDNNYLLSYNFRRLIGMKYRDGGGGITASNYEPYILKFDDLEGKIAFKKTYPDENIRKYEGKIYKHHFEEFDFIMEKKSGEYWFAGHSYWTTYVENGNPYETEGLICEFPYLVKTNAHGEIISMKNVQKELFDSGEGPSYQKSFVWANGKLFYDSEREIFARFVVNKNFLIVQEFDTNFTRINDDKNSRFELSKELSKESRPNLLVEKLSNGNYFVFVKLNLKGAGYHGGLYRIYTPNLEIVADNYFDDEKKQELRRVCQIDETKDGNILLVSLTDTNFIIKEITPEFKNVSSKTINLTEKFDNKKITPREVLFLDNKVLLMGTEDTTIFYKAYFSAPKLSERKHYKLHLLETDLTYNNQRKFSLNDSSFTHLNFVVRPSIDNKTYIVATVNRDTTAGVEYPYSLHLAKIDFSSSISASDLVTSSTVFPNPIVAGEAQLSLELKQSCDVRIVLSDVLGREKLNIFSGFLESGRFTKFFDVRCLASGIYFIKTSIGDKFIVDKLMINR